VRASTGLRLYDIASRHLREIGWFLLRYCVAFIVALLALAGSDSSLGNRVRQDGFSFRPPTEFHVVPMPWFRDTQALAVQVGNERAHLALLLQDGNENTATSDDDSIAMLAVSQIDAPLDTGTKSRDLLAQAVTRHFKINLGLPFELERVESQSNRIEALGLLHFGNQVRRVLVSAFPHEERHLVLVASVPVSEWDALKPGLAASFDSMELDVAASIVPKRTGMVLAASMLVLLAGSGWLWRKKRAAIRNQNASGA
jgi:hypothetical protein